MDNAATPGPELERGWSDIGLAAMGRREARREGKELADLHIQALVSSDLPRAKQSARIMGDVAGIEPEFVSQLRTWNLGDVTGKPQAQADRLKAQLARHAPDRVPPGGESFECFVRRVFAAVSDVLIKHPGRLALVVHGNVERVLKAWDAAGAKRDHTIDVDVFLRHGESPGHVEPWKVDPARLKLSHDESEFHDAKPKGDRCGICKAYGGVNKCTKVRPPMDADDWCAVGVARSDGHWFNGGLR
jgi:broad specificity phosphatase PhoE